MKKEESAYWKAYYDNPEIVSGAKDLNQNIARTRHGVVVDKPTWSRTIDHISDLLSLSSQSSLLELCCGNGAILGRLAPRVKVAVGVDYSDLLLDQLRTNFNYANLKTINHDVNSYDITPNTYHAILIYFSIQHFSERDTFILIKRCISALKPRGRLLVGDIPDEYRKWDYISSPEYKRDYFQRLEDTRPMIGNWFAPPFFKAMKYSLKDVSVQVINQPDYQINSDYRFDVIFTKGGAE